MSRPRTSRKAASSSRTIIDIEEDLANAVAFVRLLDVMMLFGCDQGLDSDDASAAAKLLEHLAPIVRRLKGDLLPRPSVVAGGEA